MTRRATARGRQQPAIDRGTQANAPGLTGKADALLAYLTSPEVAPVPLQTALERP